MLTANQGCATLPAYEDPVGYSLPACLPAFPRVAPVLQHLHYSRQRTPAVHREHRHQRPTDPTEGRCGGLRRQHLRDGLVLPTGIPDFGERNHLGVCGQRSAWIITTIAGTGVEGYSGDNGPAQQAQLFQPRQLALDNSGNLYIADQMNHRVRKISASGTIITVAGNGQTGTAGDGGAATAAQVG